MLLFACFALAQTKVQVQSTLKQSLLLNILQIVQNILAGFPPEVSAAIAEEFSRQLDLALDLALENLTGNDSSDLIDLMPVINTVLHEIEDFKILITKTVADLTADLPAKVSSAINTALIYITISTMVQLCLLFAIIIKLFCRVDTDATGTV
jgi:hypothetical protein